jgi:hypothetical protein
MTRVNEEKRVMARAVAFLGAPSAVIVSKPGGSQQIEASKRKRDQYSRPVEQPGSRPIKKNCGGGPHESVEKRKTKLAEAAIEIPTFQNVESDVQYIADRPSFPPFSAFP